MRLLLIGALATSLAAALAAASCGSSNSTMSCRGGDQIEVDYFRGPRDGDVVCAPLPITCGGTGSCAVTACIRDMYAACDSPYLGVGCSDTFPPTIISCNP